MIIVYSNAEQQHVYASSIYFLMTMLEQWLKLAYVVYKYKSVWNIIYNIIYTRP